MILTSDEGYFEKIGGFMSWKIKCMDKKYLTKSLDLVEQVFTESGEKAGGGNKKQAVLSAGTGINHDG